MRGGRRRGCCPAEFDPSERFQHPSPRSSGTPAGRDNLSDYSLVTWYPSAFSETCVLGDASTSVLLRVQFLFLQEVTTMKPRLQKDPFSLVA